MAKGTTRTDTDFTFYSQLHYFYEENKGKIRSRYNDLTKAFLDHNDRDKNPGAFLRPPQFQALEMYVFIKEFMDNKSVVEMFDDWRNHRGSFADQSYYSIAPNGQGSIVDDLTAKQADALFTQMKDYQESYPNYIYALTMGLGKTILMATCVFYEFLLSNKYPKDKRFCHNALIFAPDKTVLESLREIVTFDKSKVVPTDYTHVLDENIKIHFLDGSSALHVIDDSDFNIIISNSQKIIVTKKHKEERPVDLLFKGDSLLASIYGNQADDEITNDSQLNINQRFQKLCRLKQLGVYVDEAHHLFGADLEKQLRAHDSAKTSLRTTINRLAQNTSIVACYNYTGTPFVKQQPLPEVVYAYGLRESIRNGFLKDARLKGFDNVKSEDFLRSAITDFWESYEGKTYEGLNPKLAIFASTIEEADTEVRPTVEKILADLDINTNKILVNVGDAKITKDEDIHNFNNLDSIGSAGNEKQFVILVGKGREGWNCRSLFGVAMFRSPKSKVFVLQATMRCLRQISDEQQTAKVFLSQENFDILNAELENNFKMDIGGLRNPTEAAAKKVYQVRVVPPPHTITLKRLTHRYTQIEKEYVEPVDFGYPGSAIDDYLAKHLEHITEKRSLRSESVAKVTVIQNDDKDDFYNLYTLTAEIAQYMNVSPQLINRILRECKDKPENLLVAANQDSDIIYDIFIPTIAKTLYEIQSVTTAQEDTLTLLRQPKNAGYYEFKAKPELVIKNSDDNLREPDIAKSFHADTYCFDSRPERELFIQYLESSQTKEVYFTGMFTAEQGDLAIQYYDPESKRLRHYYPDFVARMADGTLQLIEVKGDNMLEDPTVRAKKEAATELATATEGVEYIMYAGSQIIGENVLEGKTALQTNQEVTEAQ